LEGAISLADNYETIKIFAIYQMSRFCPVLNSDGYVIALDLGSISSTFYEQLLGLQIPKAQKRQSSCQFFAHLGSAHTKAARRKLMKLTLVFKVKGRMA